MSFLVMPQNRVQAALTGRVIDAQTLATVAAVEVKITGVPAAFQKVIDARKLMHGGAWETMKERVDLTSTRRDGMFHFIDLPNGTYTLTFSMPGLARRYGSTTASVTVTRNGQGKVTTPFTTVNLPPTAIKGKVHRFVPASPGNPATTAPLWMAEVQAKGSGEYSYSNSTGDFYLTDVEPGSRTLVVKAPGFQTGTVTIMLVQGSVAAPSPNPFVIFP